jgi:hypothetical protein
MTVALEAEARSSGVLHVGTGGVPARVFVDGVDAGTTPIELPTDPGEHDIRVEADGYEPASRTVTVAEGARETVGFALTPLASPPSVAESAAATPVVDAETPAAEDDAGDLWWLWTAIGVVVAGGAVTAGVLLWPEGDPSYDLRRSVP